MAERQGSCHQMLCCSRMPSQLSAELHRPLPTCPSREAWGPTLLLPSLTSGSAYTTWLPTAASPQGPHCSLQPGSLATELVYRAVT